MIRFFFDREHLYGDKSGDYPDNAERFTEFSRVAIEFMKRIWLPDVVHCHDWQSALVPLLLGTQHASDPAVRAADGFYDSQPWLSGIIPGNGTAP
jgi:starch synthase